MDQKIKMQNAKKEQPDLALRECCIDYQHLYDFLQFYDPNYQWFTLTCFLTIILLCHPGLKIKNNFIIIEL